MRRPSRTTPCCTTLFQCCQAHAVGLLVDKAARTNLYWGANHPQIRFVRDERNLVAIGRNPPLGMKES
ncbi:hypothetical protein PF005_g9 [Phytophthora fragariae]|uniref:Uncharacterized protein n=1 Tax=Phytophthora fragariae TaxID=53985 RepID=A0A6A3V8W8_9STRA|nr:hypothetical protein PF003_g5737 [Phytophthora fragariae]KAE8950465.1 hypothetical protein PF009_g10 [Phytophthora fragariae]KAE9008509.1 hypothetical protein PF011_g10683 [Phytophthora fragariae]KAE9121220.1 hypothetical protein PF010_g7193 [Phytophthora fragariae]KAE9141611.1 hypothetical protein PF007_g123 [Phytophthora fragariae]